MRITQRNYHGVQPCQPTPPLEYLDNWIPLTPIEQMERTDYDVIIVGSGAGGGAVLWRLCDKWRRNGKRIALLERGDLLLPTHAINLPTFNFERLARFLENPKYKHRITDFSSNSSLPLDFTQFIALGGRTIHWGTGSPRFHPLDFTTWPIRYDDLIPYYKIAERVMAVSQHFTKGSYIQQTLIKRLKEIGYSETMDFPLAINFKTMKFQATCMFSSIDLLGYCLDVGTYDLAVNARVVQVLTEKGVVSGVKVITPDKRSHFIKGKTVVLSTSTFENPRILLFSDIRCEAIGRNLINHSNVGANGILNISNYSSKNNNIAILIPRTPRRLYQVQIHGQHQPYEYHWDHCKSDSFIECYIQGFGGVESRMENGVSLDLNQFDEDGVPKLHVEFRYSQRDLEIVQQMVSTIHHQAANIGLSLNELCLKAPGLDYHESGTCRMGKNPYTSVTNQFGEMHHVSNLFVADSSVLPFIGATNPTLTIVALAVRTADYIRFKASSQ